MKTLVGSDEDPYEKYRREFQKIMGQIATGLKRAGSFGGRK